MFDNYYEIEKMMQIQMRERLRQAKQERLAAGVSKNRRTKRGLLAVLIILKKKLK